VILLLFELPNKYTVNYSITSQWFAVDSLCLSSRVYSVPIALAHNMSVHVIFYTVFVMFDV